MKWLFVVVAIVLGCAAAEARRIKKSARPRLNMPPGWTWPPSAKMKADGQKCLAQLTELGVKWEKGPATPKIVTPILLTNMEIGGVKLTSIWRKGPFPMDCYLALAFAERGAAALRAAGIAEIRFAGIHDYRNVAGKKVLSRHALGLAMDAFEFVDDNGDKHIVKSDYREGDETLWAMEDYINDTGAFRLLLTPGNDPRHHYDHFHFEARTNTEAVVSKVNF
ncbi:MAG TPA: extensin family protein [Haliangiales bacterium]|nr:extensin family protein [Haliangiales bacterium]